jgi:hypothetical protein
MLFSQSIMLNLVLTNSSGPKRHAVLLTAPVSVCFTQILVGGGGTVAIAAFPHPDFSLQYPSLMAEGRSSHRFVVFLAHRV